MLVLTRRRGQAICIGEHIRVLVTRIGDGQVRLGIETPQGVSVVREELLDSVRKANRAARDTVPNDFTHWLQVHRPALGNTSPEETP
ncbi:MAG: carbon storage regulator [Acidithiobacillus sp.]